MVVEVVLWWWDWEREGGGLVGLGGFWVEGRGEEELRRRCWRIESSGKEEEEDGDGGGGKVVGLNLKGEFGGVDFEGEIGNAGLLVTNDPSIAARERERERLFDGLKVVMAVG